MKLKDFITKFIEPNTLIRLWYQIEDGHKGVDEDNVKLEHEVKKSKYAECKVVYITDIFIGGLHSEAVSIVIEEAQEVDHTIGFIDWLMENCELSSDHSLWSYYGEDYTNEKLFEIYKQSLGSSS